MTNGVVEYQMGRVTDMSQRMMQFETDKFVAAVSLTQDYYNSMESNQQTTDPAEKPVSQVISGNLEEQPQTEPLPPIQVRAEVPEGQPKPEETYPRLDKFFQLSLQAQALAAQITNPTGGDAAADKNKKKDPKKAAVEDENANKLYYENDLKESIANEKRIYRFRLTMIRNWALQRLKEI